MKKSLLKTAACLLFVGSLISCSSESDIDLTTDASAIVPERENRSSVWNGIIGEDVGGGDYVITADSNSLLADLQDIINKEAVSFPTTLETIKIEVRTALNDPGHASHMLIATDRRGTSIGVMLTRGSTGLLKLDESFGVTPKTVSCRGCASGCNLEYLYIDGKKVPICNENGCISDCTKSETEL
ncbi:hypothetical protein [Flavobacterium sp.]|uniref:hypothetical protein n=1 Tax=Flavobacterium sp. TaxID=239 RepID=UPI004033BC15